MLTATPPVVACMDRYGLETLYAYYWDAKAPMFLSGYRVHIVQIEPDGSRSSWNTNERWNTTSIVDGSPVAAR